jgi:hypothetical protein
MNKETLFDHAVQRLSSGESFSEVTKGLPEEIKEMLMIVAEIQQTSEQTSLIPQTQTVHKQKFLSKAVEHKAASPFSIFLNLVPRLAILFLVLGISLTLTGLVSAQSVPGDVLYGVKRTFEQVQLNLTNASSGKVQLEEVFDARRVREVQKMFEAQRRDEVQFAGWLDMSVKGRLSIEGLPLIFPADSVNPVDQLGNAYVEVTGQLQPEGVLVKSLQLRLFNLSGVLTQSEDNQWFIDGVPFEQSPETRIVGVLKAGQQADMTAVHIMDERFLALVIVMRDQAEGSITNPPLSFSPSNTPSDAPSLVENTLPVVPTLTRRVTTPMATSIQNAENKPTNKPINTAVPSITNTPQPASAETEEPEETHTEEAQETEDVEHSATKTDEPEETDEAEDTKHTPEATRTHQG